MEHLIKKPIKVLLVDDDEDFVQDYQFSSRKSKYTELTALDNEVAFNEIISSDQIFQYDCFVLDYKLEKSDALGLVSQIKAKHPEASCFIISHLSQAEIVREASDGELSNITHYNIDFFFKNDNKKYTVLELKLVERMKVFASGLANIFMRYVQNDIDKSLLIDTRLKIVDWAIEAASTQLSRLSIEDSRTCIDAYSSFARAVTLKARALTLCHGVTGLAFYDQVDEASLLTRDKIESDPFCTDTTETFRGLSMILEQEVRPLSNPHSSTENAVSYFLEQFDSSNQSLAPHRERDFLVFLYAFDWLTSQPLDETSLPMACDNLGHWLAMRHDNVNTGFLDEFIGGIMLRQSMGDIAASFFERSNQENTRGLSKIETRLADARIQLQRASRRQPDF